MPRRFLKHPSWNKYRPAARRFLRKRYGRVRRRVPLRRRTGAKRFRFKRRGRTLSRGVRSRRGRKNSFRFRFKQVGRPQVARAQYGQTQRVSHNSNSVPACEYFTTESYNTAQTKSAISTRSLYNLYHMALLSDLVWIGNVSSGGTLRAATLNAAYDGMDIASRIKVKGKAKYTIRNMANETETFTAYYCKARRNISWRQFTSTAGSQTSIVNLYYFLAAGFANNGLDPANADPNTNDYMTEQDFTPFNSIDFTENFKIFKTKTFKLDGGADKTLSLSGRTYYFKPKEYYRLYGSTGGVNWRTADPLFLNWHGESFILFKLNSRMMTRNAAQTTYSQSIDSTTPRFAMQTKMSYKVAAMSARFTPYYDIETIGWDAAASTADTIINEKTYLVSTQVNTST